MARTLKERYEVRKVQQLKERVTIINRQLLEENRVARLIMEAMNQEDLDKVSAIIQKLESIKNASGGDLKTLVSGIEQAQSDVNKYTSGGPLVKAWAKMKGKFGVDNPIVKVTTFASALERGFKQLPQILKNNGVSQDDLKKNVNADNQITLRDAIVKQFIKTPDATANALKKTIPNKNEDVSPGPKPDAKVRNNSKGIFDSPPDTAGIQASHDAQNNPKAQAKIKMIVGQLQKALSPAGIFGAFKKVPYVDSTALAQDLLNAHVSNLVAVSKAVTSGPQTTDVAPDMKAYVTGHGENQTTDTGQAHDVNSASQTQPSEPAKSTIGTSADTGVGEKPGQGPGEKRGGGANNKPNRLENGAVQELARFITKKTGVNNDAVLKILNLLNNNNKLRG